MNETIPSEQVKSLETSNQAPSQNQTNRAKAWLQDQVKSGIFLRYLVVSFVFYLGIFYTLSVLGNVTDYHFNVKMVEQMLSMKGVPVHAGVVWRAIQSHFLEVAAYWVIVLVEALIAVLAFLGAWVMLCARKLDAKGFDQAKAISLIAIGLGISLYFFGYLVVGDQWFRAWMGSGAENVEGLGFEFVGFFSLLFLIVRHTR